MSSSAVCALCSATDALSTFQVPSREEPVTLCGTCRPQVEGAPLDPKHWYCLQESAWSQEPVVQVVAWRLLHQLRGEGWAAELLEQLYIEDDVLAWAQEAVDDSDDEPSVVDSNGTRLQDGDSVTLIRDLDVKGANFTAKRGTLVKNIRLGDNPGLIEGKVHKVAIFLKTEYLKKAN
ncbi:MAG: PhnA domain-containing protein [Deltaproteobacteria bacterium]|nr:PhnA domain-containing protein [Deltaproteobacteria bacterium]